MNGVVLLIDDDPSTRDILKTGLQWKGYRVIECDNADDGLRLARQEHPTVIVTEFLIPARNSGRCVVEELKRDPATNGIPALVFTTNNLPEVRRRISAAGADCMVKPAASRLVLRHIDRLAAGV